MIKRSYKEFVALLVLVGCIVLSSFFGLEDFFVLQQLLEAQKSFEIALEKKLKSTTALSLVLAQLVKKGIEAQKFKELPKLLREYTDYKNLWFHIVSKDGETIIASWTKERFFAPRVKNYFAAHRPFATVDICRYALVLKSVAPLEDKIVAVISHFNSLAKTIKEKFGIDVVVLATKRASNEIAYPYTGRFVQGRYVANFRLDEDLEKWLKETDLQNVLTGEIETFGNYYCSSLPLVNWQGERVGDALFLLPKSSFVDHLFLDKLTQRLLLFMGILFASVFVLLTWLFSSKKRALQEQARYYYTILDVLQEIVLVTNGRRILYANRKFFEYTGFRDLEDFFRHHQCLCDLFIEDEGFIGPKIKERKWIFDLVEHPNETYLAKMKSHKGEFIFRIKASQIEDGKYAVILADITKEYAIEQELRYQALYDPLTGLYNRRSFNDIFERFFKKDSPLWLAILDIDHFKQINDTFGHDRGDEVLKECARRLRHLLRMHPYIFRIGGEEFAILIEAKEDEIEAIAKRIQESLRSKPCFGERVVTMSGGFAKKRKNESKEELFKRADRYLYQAKEKRDTILIEGESI